MRLWETVRATSRTGIRPLWWMGRAWRRPEYDQEVFVVIPLNWLLSAGREIYFRIVWGFKPLKEWNVYRQGFKDGREYEARRRGKCVVDSSGSVAPRGERDVGRQGYVTVKKEVNRA